MRFAGDIGWNIYDYYRSISWILFVKVLEMLGAGFWVLVAGYWGLVAGYWLLVTGGWLLRTEV